MFKLDLSPTFRAPVSFAVQGKDGTRQNHTFEADFRRLTSDEQEALSRRIVTDRLTDRQVAELLLVGWHGITNAAGNAIEFDPASLVQVLNVAGIGSAIVAAFQAAQPGAALGN